MGRDFGGAAVPRPWGRGVAGSGGGRGRVWGCSRVGPRRAALSVPAEAALEFVEDAIVLVQVTQLHAEACTRAPVNRGRGGKGRGGWSE